MKCVRLPSGLTLRLSDLEATQAVARGAQYITKAEYRKTQRDEFAVLQLLKPVRRGRVKGVR